MTKRQRSFLFFLMVAVFLILGPLVILYSQGYRIDFEERKVVQTGAFYFSVTPRSVEVRITPEDGERSVIKNTDFIFGTAFTENFIPKRYRVEVRKSGYHPWEKTLEIREKMVAELKNITLIRENPELTILSENIERFFPGESSIIFQKKDGDIWHLSLYSLRDDSETLLISSDKISEQKSDIVDLNFSEKSKRAILEIEFDDEIRHYLIDTENGSGLFIPFEVDKVSLHPRDNSKIVLQRGPSLLSYDYEASRGAFLANNVIAYDAESLHWLSDDGFLFMNPENPKRLNRHAFEIKNGKKYEIFLPNFYETMIVEDDIFYLFNRESEKFEEVFRSPYKPVRSPDLAKIAHFTDHELRIFFLSDIADQPQRKYGENLFLTRFSGKIGSVRWYTSHYLVFTIGDEIRVAEIDNRDRINIITLVSLRDPEIFFSGFNKRLYILSSGTLFASRQLIP